MTIQPLTPFTGLGPLTNITPFTYRDNSNYLSILRMLINSVNENIDLTNKNFEDLIAEFNTEISGALAEWLAKFNEFMDDVVEQLEGLNDEAMANLLVDPETQTGQAFLELTAEFVRLVEPNTLYVDPVAGVDSNEGSLALPLKTVNEAFKRTEINAQKADTEWIINLAAGSYNERVRPAEFTPFALKIVVQGPEIEHPGTPMVTFTEGSNASAVAVFLNNPNANIEFRYITFFGYKGTVSSAGIDSSNGEVRTVNCHFDSCYYGFSSTHGIQDVKGGIFQNNTGAGIRSMAHNYHAIGVQNAGNWDNGPIFRDNENAIFSQGSCAGHADWCTFEDNVNAISLNINSRTNADGAKMLRNTRDYNLRGNSHVNIPDNVVFGAGADKSTQTAVITGGSQAPSPKALDVDMTYARTEQSFWADYAQRVITGTLAVQTLFDISLKAPWWGDQITFTNTTSKRVRMRAIGSTTGTAGIKRFNFRIGSLICGTTLGATEDGNFYYEGDFYFTGPSRQIGTSRFEQSLENVNRVTTVVGALDMTTDQSLKLEVSLDDAADTITFEMIELIFG